MKRIRIPPPFSTSLALAALLAAPVLAAPRYRVLQRIPLGGEGGWDYLALDSGARRLYITRGSRVVVLDAETGKTVGEVPGTPGVHGVALAAESGRGFTSNGKTSTVTVFDLKTLKSIAEIKVTGEGPDAILYDPASGRVFAFNGRSDNATAIDAVTAKVVGTIALGGRPEFASTDRKGRVFVNIEDRSEVVVLDSRGLAVEKRWALAPCEEPSGMAIDRERGRLFVGCHNKMMAVVDAATGRVVATPAIGQGVDANAFDPSTGLAFSSNGDGTLTVVHQDSPDHYSVVENVPTQRGARTMALDEKTHRIFLVTADFGPAPEPTAAQPHPRAPVVPGTFVLLVVGQ